MATDSDVVIIHKPHEKSENPYLPFVGKYNMVVYYLYLLSLIFIHFYYPTPSYVLQISKSPNNRLLYYLKHNKMHVPFSKTVLLVNN